MRRALIIIMIFIVVFGSIAFADNVMELEGYVLIADFQGTGIKQTESFDIPTHEWAIVYITESHPEYGDMNFQIYVYRSKDDMLVSVAANVIGEATDYSIIRGAGKHYLMINAMQPYRIGIYCPE